MSNFRKLICKIPIRRYLFWLTGSLDRLTPTVMTQQDWKLPKELVPTSFSMMDCAESVDSRRFIKFLWEFNIFMAIKCAEFVWPRQINMTFQSKGGQENIFSHEVYNFTITFLLWRFKFLSMIAPNSLEKFVKFGRRPAKSSISRFEFSKFQIFFFKIQ